MKRLAGFTAICFAAMLAVSFSVSAAVATAPPDHKVTLCHRTGSATNPYVIITTDIASDGYVKGGHNNHEQVGNGLGGDIIPAYTYGDFSYPGKNLDTIIGGVTGETILEAGCVVPSESPSPTPTPTDTPPPSTTPPTCHTDHSCWKPTWTPTWSPTHAPAHPQTAFTGSTRGTLLAGGAAIGLLLTGGGLLLLRRKVVG